MTDRRLAVRAPARRRVARLLVVALVATALNGVVALSRPTPARAAGTLLFSQSFRTNTVDPASPVSVPALPSGTPDVNTVCLSAAGNTTGTLPRSCPTATDANGSGTLRLTDATTNKTGGLFAAASVPTSQGLDATFTLYQYGGSSADGMTFVLAAVDPAAPTAPASIGQSGGALGYTGTSNQAGLANGYLGIGFDVYGNYSTTAYQGTGCATKPFIIGGGRIAGQVVVRGPGRGTVGYCGLNSTAATAPSPVVPLRATSRAASAVPVEVVINPTTSPITTGSGIVVPPSQYRVVFTPVGGTARTLQGALPVVPTGLYPSASWLNPNGIPKQLAFGWVGSTGSITDYHEVAVASVTSFNPVPQLVVAATSYVVAAPAPGDPVTYTVTSAVTAGADETQPVTVTVTLPVGTVALGAYGTGWVCGAPSGRTISCVDSSAPFANGTALPPVTVVGIVTATGVTAATVRTGTVSTASASDANPGYSAVAPNGTVATTPSGIAVSPTTGPAAGGTAVAVTGSALTGATAVLVGTAAQLAAGTPTTLLPCAGGATTGCFVANGNGTISIPAMPAHATGAVLLDVVTQGVAGSATYTYVAVPAAPARPTATAGSSSATVTWVAPADNASPITGYVVTPIRNGVAQTPVAYDASATTRTLTGLTPGASYTFTVAAVNAVGTGPASPASVAVVPYTVPAAPTITAVSAGTASATVTYTTPANGSSPITGWVITPYIGDTAQTPQAFSGTGTTRIVTGLTPGTAYSFTVAAVNAAGTGPESARSGPVTPNVTPALANPAPPAGEVGAAYTDQLTGTGGTTPYVWSLSAGTLPPGVTLSAGTGLLSGTPTAAGTYPFTVRITDAGGATATQALSIAVAAAPTLTFPDPPAGQVGIAYSDQLTVTGGTGPYAWSVTAGALPAGITLNPTTGLLSGTPTAGGVSTFTVRVVDAAGQSVSRTVSITIAARPTLANPPPPAGQVGLAYTDQLAVAGGTGPYSWVVSSGSLPAGLTLSAAGGLISGTPTATGTAAFSVQVTDSTGQTAVQAFTLTIGVGPLVIQASTGVATTAPGGTVRFTVTVTNTATAAFTGVTFSQPLPDVLDDAGYNGDVTASRGTATVVSGTVSWTGDLPADAVATISYTVTVLDPDPGSRILAAAVTSSTPGSTCPAAGTDPRCAVSVPVAVLQIVTTADAATTTPGGVVGYRMVVTNTGQAAFPAASLSTVLTGVQDDAVYRADASATAGVVSFASPTLSWTGALAVGATVTITYTVAVRAPDPGDKLMVNTVVSGSAGSTCPAGGTDPRCTVTVTVLVPALTITNTADASTTAPGSTVSYALTIANTGQTPYAGLTVTDGLAGVLDDATYAGDASATVGAVSIAGSNLTWTGDLATGAAAVVTFTVVVRAPDPGDRALTAVATSAAAGSSCPAPGTATGCTSVVTVLVPGLAIVKTADVATTTPGSTVHYTITITNSGQTPYAGATVTDALTGVLDDATYLADATATSGTVSYAAPTLTWTGSLAAGAAATVTYSVRVTDPDTGDRSLVNTATSTAAGSTCPTGGTDPRCTATVAVRVPGLTFDFSTDVATATPGTVVHYTLRATNTGETGYTAAHFTLDLAGSLDDSTYDNDAALVGPGGLTFNADGTVDWTGDLAVGQTVVVTGSVTINDPDTGDLVIRAVVASAAPGSTCPVGSANPACVTVVTVLIPGLTLTKTADRATTVPGGTVSYTITAVNTGQSPYAAAALTDSLAVVLGDASWNADALASTGTLTYTEPTLSWTGALAVGASVTITYSVTVRDPDPGDKTLVNTVVSGTPGANCPAGGTDGRCTATVTVLVPGVTLAMAADVAAAAPGDTVHYTITVTNSGQTPYASLTVTDPLAAVLDDATYGADAVATGGTVSYAGSTLSWTGALDVGASVTITYSVTVAVPSAGDRILASTLSSTAAGNTCPAGGTDPRCTTRVTVSGLSILSTADVATTTPGSVVRFTTVFTNSGATPYVDAVVFLDASGAVDDASTNGDQTASSGTLILDPEAPYWIGDIPVGGSVTVTSSFTVLDPDPGDRVMTGAVSSVVPGSSCPTAAGAGCTVTVPVLVPALSIVTTADVSTTTPGARVSYTVTVTNSGQTPYPGVAVDIPLAGLAGDADYAADAGAGSGIVTTAGSGANQVLTWTGDLAPDGVVTVTYSVVVKNPDPGGKVLVARASSTAVGSSCPPGSGNAGCTLTVPVLSAGLTIVHTAAATTATPGTAVLFTVTVRNTGQLPYAAAAFSLDLSDGLDDAAVTGTPTATTGTVTWSTPILSWTGALAPGGTAVVTYTLTVDNPHLGDAGITGTVVSATAGNNCPAGGADSRCTATVDAVDTSTLTVDLRAEVPSAVIGQTVHYTVTVTNSGAGDYSDPAFTASFADVLDNATYQDDAEATDGTVDLTDGSLTWSADTLPAGATATITLSVTVVDVDGLLTARIATASGGATAGAPARIPAAPPRSPCRS